MLNCNALYDYESFSVSWDENGNIATNDFATPGKLTYIFNWDNKLRKAEWTVDPQAEDSIEIKYDPLGNRVYKKSTASGNSTERKYIVDITGRLPVILMAVNGSGGIVKTNIYGDRQILAQHDGDMSDFKYFYLHDRLGSVRLVIDYDEGDVVKYYTYEPFGEVIDDDGTFDNAFMFTGQYFDSEIEEYYLRARQYNPAIARFTSRDPVRGEPFEPLTLHEYLYCLNDPINGVDPRGESALKLKCANAIITGAAFYGHTINLSAYAASSGDWGFFDLAEATAKFIVPAMALAFVNPLGPIDRLAIYGGEGIFEATSGSKTGFTWGEALAVDVVAYAGYYGYMSVVEQQLSIDLTDMMTGFLSWKRDIWQ